MRAPADGSLIMQVLSLMLEQTGLHLAAFPETPFVLKNWTAHGHHCLLDKTPDRMLDIQVWHTHLPLSVTILLHCIVLAAWAFDIIDWLTSNNLADWGGVPMHR
jgi:hypothetical protein